MTDTPRGSADFLDPDELARVHCDALHSSTHPPKMARPCLSSQEQMAIVAEAWNTRSGGYRATPMGTGWSRGVRDIDRAIEEIKGE